MASPGDNDDFITSETTGSVHREKVRPKGDTTEDLINRYCMVAKPVPRKMWDPIPKARAAVNAEWAKLRACDNGRGTRDETLVRPFWEVKKFAQAKIAESGIHTHFGFFFELCVEKHSKLEEAKRRYKGRVVFGGHAVRDKFSLEAQFPDQGSGASLMSAAKLADAVALLPSCSGQQSDAVRAYTQAKLGTGMKTSTEVM